MDARTGAPSATAAAPATHGHASRPAARRGAHPAPSQSWKRSPTPRRPTGVGARCGCRIEGGNSNAAPVVTRHDVRTSHTLITEHRGLVRASLRRLGVVGAALEDAEQEVFLVLVRRRGDFDPTRSERGWIWGICRNVALAQRRAAQRRGRVESPSACGAHPPFEERIAATRALGALDEGSRALWLGRCEGLTAAELAAALGVPVTTVQWRLRQAKRSVRAALRGLARSGHALVTWLLRPQQALGSVLLPAVSAVALSPSPAEKPPYQEAPAPVATAVAPPPTVEHLRFRPTAPARAAAPTPVATGPERPPRSRRPRSVGRVSLGDPSVDEDPSPRRTPAPARASRGR